MPASAPAREYVLAWFNHYEPDKLFKVEKTDIANVNLVGQGRPNEVQRDKRAEMAWSNGKSAIFGLKAAHLG